MARPTTPAPMTRTCINLSTRHGWACSRSSMPCAGACKDVDAGHIRAFTPVFDGLWPGMTECGFLRPRACLGDEVRAQRLAPVRDRGDFLLFQQDLGLL